MQVVDNLLNTSFPNNLSIKKLEALRQKVIHEIGTIEEQYSSYKEVIDFNKQKLERKFRIYSSGVFSFTFILCLLLNFFVAYSFLFTSKTSNISLTLMVLFIVLMSILFSFISLLVFINYFEIKNPQINMLQEKNLINPLKATFEYVSMKMNNDIDPDIIHTNVIDALILKNDGHKLFSKLI